MPVVESRIRIEYSNLLLFLDDRRYRNDIRIAAAEPVKRQQLEKAREVVEDEAAAKGDELAFR